MADWTPPASDLVANPSRPTWKPPEGDRVSQLWDQAKGSPAPAGEAPPSRLGALWEGIKQAGKNFVIGGAQLGARMQEPSYFQPTPDQGLINRVDQRAQQSAQAYATNPSAVKYPNIAGAGRFAGNVGITAPLALIPGGATSLAGRAALGASTGAIGSAMAPVTGGNFAVEKAKQIGAGLGVGGALGGAGRMIGPPLGRAAQDAISQFPHIAGLLRGTMYSRTPDAFQRAAANQALSPIGQVVPPATKAGHDLINRVTDTLTDAYNRVIPNLSIPSNSYSTRLQLAQRLTEIKESIEGRVDEAKVPQLAAFLKKHLESYFESGKPIDGDVIKTIQSNLGKEASRWSGNSDLSAQTYGDALYNAREAFMDAVAKENPQWAEELSNINKAYANFIPIRDAAARAGVDAAGQFTPKTLFEATRRQDLSPGKGQFAAGAKTMGALAEAANGPMSAPKVNRLLMDVIGGVVGAAAGYEFGAPLRGGAAGLAAGAIAPAVARSAQRVTQSPAGRMIGRGVSDSAPSVSDFIGAKTTSPP